MPIRSFESEQYGVLVQEVTESSCTSPGQSIENICHSTFGLPKRYEFGQSGIEYQTTRDGIEVLMKLSSLERLTESAEKQKTLSQTHRLVEVAARARQRGIKDASKAVESVFLDLDPCVVRTIN